MLDTYDAAQSSRYLQDVASARRSAQAKKAQDEQDDHHKADNVYDAVHSSSSWSQRGQTPPI
jgi:hypothetical protein